MLLDAPNSDPMAVSIAFGHHRTTTGGGYPDTLHRPDLSLATKIVKICDVYEALTAVRPYKPRMSPTRAYRIMIAMQDHFDAPVLKRFIQVNGIYPTGTRVRLSDGSVARVERQTKAPLLPVVDVEVTAEGRVLPREEQRTIDLNARSGAEALEVTTGLLEAEYA
jgi:HD-GYP domain-containing protein (c-di-GMP phosphodiesterase class II)